MKIPKLMWMVVASLAFLLSCSDEVPREQSAPAEPVEAGMSSSARTALHGRIVAIMRDGHVEPARVPDITLVRLRDPNNPDASLRADEAFSRVLPMVPPGNFLQKCTKVVWLYHAATAAAEATRDYKHEADVIEGTGDEEGNFEFENIAPGRYRIVALAQAGSTPEALWSGIADVDEGQNNHMTMNLILLACTR
jgi:hypothetical protein